MILSFFCFFFLIIIFYWCYSPTVLLFGWENHRACIVDSENRIIGLGYNGFPRGCSDDQLPWARGNTNELFNKYLYVCHAEVNAILNKGSANVKGATIYVALVSSPKDDGASFKAFYTHRSRCVFLLFFFS